MKQIPLTQGKFALVDDEDFDYLNQWKWFAIKNKHTFYAVRHDNKPESKRKLIRMHRFILGETCQEILIDHKNGNGLDNQRNNIRRCTQAQNARNRRNQKNNVSGVKGVRQVPGSGRWMARIRKDGVSNYLGMFDTKEAAGIAYDIAASRLHDDFARPNTAC